MAIHILGSTGPRSLAGKNRSRMNAFKHGGYAKTKILPFESEAEYKKLSKEMLNYFAPEGFAQKDLVHKMIDELWVIERLQLQAGFRRDELCEELTPVKLAAMLKMDERFIKYAPDYLINPNHKLKRPIKNVLAQQLGDYEELMIKAKDVANFDVVWKTFRHLFEGLYRWLPSHYEDYPELIMSHGKNLNIQWQNNPHKLLEVMEVYVAELYYAYHFEDYRAEIRHVMAGYFFLRKTSQHSDHVSNELIMKHQRAYQSLIDSFVKLQKSCDEHAAFLKRLSGFNVPDTVPKIEETNS